MGETTSHRHDDLVPIERAKLSQRVVQGPCDQIVAHLQLRLAHEESAVGVGARTELQLQHEVVIDSRLGPGEAARKRAPAGKR